MRLSDTENTMIDAMARAFFVSAWADKQERSGRSFSGMELMDVAPRTPRYARDFALMFAGRLPNLLGTLYNAAWADVLEDEKITVTDVPYRFLRPDLEDKVSVYVNDDKYVKDLGHYLAMQGMGHGVSWFDDHAAFPIHIPFVEAYL